MGSGDAKYADFLRRAEDQNKGKVAGYVGFKQDMEHKIIAGIPNWVFFGGSSSSKSEGTSLIQFYNLFLESSLKKSPENLRHPPRLDQLFKPLALQFETPR